MMIDVDGIGMWHEARFPDATAGHIALKLCEEAGEVARAVNIEPRGDLAEELADVMIVASALAYRADIDLRAAIGAKFMKLIDRATEREADAERVVVP